MIVLTRDQAQAILAHAMAAYERDKREACGLIAGGKYVFCRNVVGDRFSSDAFQFDPREWAMAEEQGQVTAVVHSHPDMPPTPSLMDRRSCEASGIDWLIVSMPLGDMLQLSPNGVVSNVEVING